MSHLQSERCTKMQSDTTKEALKVIKENYEDKQAEYDGEMTYQVCKHGLPYEPLAADRQVGGDHYKGMAIQPVEFILANNLGFCEGNIIKYICRHAAKGGSEDIDKVIHYAELLKESKYGEQAQSD